MSSILWRPKFNETLGNILFLQICWFLIHIQSLNFLFNQPRWSPWYLPHIMYQRKQLYSMLRLTSARKGGDGDTQLRTGLVYNANSTVAKIQQWKCKTFVKAFISQTILSKQWHTFVVTNKLNCGLILKTSPLLYIFNLQLLMLS